MGKISVQEFVERGARKIDLGFEHEPALKNDLFDVVSTLFGLCCLALGDATQARALADLARAALHAQPSAGIHYRRSLALLTERLAADPALR